MKRGDRWNWLVACGACVACLMGCNELLGIEPPIVALDSSVSLDARTDDDASDNTDGGNLIDGGVDYEHTRPRWPMPNPITTGGSHPQAYDVFEDFVIDGVTRLTWQRGTSDGDMRWEEAETYCAELSLDSGGFRLPSRIELLSLLDLTQEGAAIDPDAFPNTPPVGFWSASRRAAAPAQRWGVAFGFGTNVVFQSDVSEARRVRCVRSPSDEAPMGEFVVNDAVVEDSATQLHWQQAGLSTLYEWNAATQYCRTLDAPGDGWRLPTLKELHTLVDETRENPAADSEAFPGIAAGYYWTSSTPRGFPSLAWTVGFDRGLDVFRGPPSTAFVRCVR